MTAGGVALTGAGGLALGLGGYQALATSKFGQEMGLANLQQYASVAAYGLGRLVGGTDTANRWFIKVAGSLGQLDDATQQAAASTGAAAAGGEPLIPQAAVDIYIAYRQAETEAERQYSEQRAAIVEQYGKQRAETERQHESARTRAVAEFGKQRERDARDFARNEARILSDHRRSLGQMARQYAAAERQAEQAYYSQRMQRARDFGIEMARMEEDHQRQMRYLQEDHDARVDDLVASRDALGLVNENRRYERERRRAEEEYRLEAGRCSEDFARELADNEAQFVAEREQRAAEYAEQLAEAQAQYERERAQRREEYDLRRADELAQHQERLAEMDAEHAEEMEKLSAQQRDELTRLDAQVATERARRQAAFTDQIRQLDATLLGERNTRNQYYDAMTTDLQRWLAEMRGGFTSGLPGYPAGGRSGRGGRGGRGRQMGGYASFGTYTLGEAGREFVLSASTTRRLESAAGVLSQERIAGLAEGRSGRVTVNQNFTFHGSFSESERRWFRQVAYEQALAAMGGVMS